MYPRGGACTVTVAYPTYGFAAEKDIPKVVSDSEINHTYRFFADKNKKSCDSGKIEPQPFVATIPSAQYSCRNRLFHFVVVCVNSVM